MTDASAAVPPMRGAPGLARGHRIPNFAVPTAEEKTLILYEFADGRPLVLAACALDWSDEDCRRFTDSVHASARQAGLQSVVFLGRPVDHDPGGPDAVTAVDVHRELQRQLLAPHDARVEGALHVADANLRVVQGAAVEAAALAGDSLAQSLATLLRDCLKELQAERTATPAVAPVLVVPRVLGPELCRGLIQSFQTWRPEPSPMPTGSGGLEVDSARKSRLDVVIPDDGLERELARMIAQRVLPEIHKAFQYEASHFERLKLVCYRAAESGHFATHRDNTAPSTAHRRFALTLNLNAGDYEGGELEFPEYGAKYDVPAGTALLFSGTHAHRVRQVTAGARFALISFAFGEADGPKPGS